jgi:hypothetical protein
MLLRAESGTKELPGRDSTASTYPATIDKEVAARFSCQAHMRTVWTLEATDPKRPDPSAPPPEPSQWFVAIAAPRRTVAGRSETRNCTGCTVRTVIGFAQPRFLILIATQHKASTEYGEPLQASLSSAITSHHQPTEQGPRANLHQPALITSRTPIRPDPP